MERAQAIFKSVRMLAEGEAEYIFPVLELSKRQVWEMLPEEIGRAAWSCRTPAYDREKNPRPCGRCITCADLRKHVPELFESRPGGAGDPGDSQAL
jgi:7-cyano-7-deazaguanine synthase in queuosine biosynthesis